MTRLDGLAGRLNGEVECPLLLGREVGLDVRGPPLGRPHLELGAQRVHGDPAEEAVGAPAAGEPGDADVDDHGRVAFEGEVWVHVRGLVI